MKIIQAESPEPPVFEFPKFIDLVEDARADREGKD